MSDQSTNTIDLWTCLHDGMLDALRSDLAARTLTFVVNSPFHWEFHQLPSATRFEIVGEAVRSVEAFEFEPWPNAIDPPISAPSEEAQEQRRQNTEKGRLVSSDWKAFASQIGTDEEHIILSAEILLEIPHSVLRLGINSYPNSNWRDIEVRAEKFRFFVGKKEYSAQDFEQFGDAYWDDWASQKPNATEDTKKES